MGRAAGWGVRSGAASGRNVVWQHLSTGCLKPAPPLRFYLILGDQAPRISSEIPVRQDPSRPPRKCPSMLGKLDVHLGFFFFFSYWRNHRPAGSPWSVTMPAWEEWCSWSLAAPLTLRMRFFPVSVVQEGACFSLIPGFWIYLAIVNDITPSL